MSRITGTIVAAIAGAAAGAACLTFAFSRQADLAFDMDQELPRAISGLYDPERAGTDTYAWSSGHVTLNLPGLDRRAPWSCVVRFRAARPPSVALPNVSIGVDEATVVSQRATNDLQTAGVGVPVRNTPGLRLSLDVTPTFVPGGGDTRQLGVQIDRIACKPLGWVWPPWADLRTSASTAGLFGGGLALAGASGGVSLAGALVIAIAQSIPLSTGTAPYGRYLTTVLWLGLWTVTAAVVFSRLLARQSAALFAIWCAGAVAFLRLVNLLHPAKGLSDAVFHAHRLEWVLSGRLFFTQPIRSGFEFPYAIGLYVFAIPWSRLTHNFVALLWILCVAVDALAAAVLYVGVVRYWNDRIAGAMAVAAFCLAPLTYGVLGFANLTNSFGQSVAAMTLVAATVWRLNRRDFWQLAALSALIAGALLSHVSTFMSLVLTLAAMVVFYSWRADRETRAAAWSIGIATIAAVIIAVLLYYRHFGEAYKTLAQIRAGAAAAPVAAAAPASPSLLNRVGSAASIAAWAMGWPILVLAAVGGWRLWADGARDRLTRTIWAAAACFSALFVAGVLSPVDPAYRRYLVEFVARAALAALPAVAVLSARGGSWLWRSQLIGRAALALLAGAAFWLAAREWLGWIGL